MTVHQCLLLKENFDSMKICVQSFVSSRYDWQINFFSSRVQETREFSKFLQLWVRIHLRVWASWDEHHRQILTGQIIHSSFLKILLVYPWAFPSFGLECLFLQATNDEYIILRHSFAAFLRWSFSWWLLLQGALCCRWKSKEIKRSEFTILGSAFVPFDSFYD